MPIPSFGGLGPYADFDAVVSKVNELVAELRNLLLSLDTLNIVSLNAEVIEAGTITAGKIGAHEITADKMNVSELSAISANLGHITAGLVEAIEIFGSYIATAAVGVYPRIEFSSLSKLLKAELDASNRIEMVADLIGSPAFNFITALMVGRLFAADSTLVLSSNQTLQLSGIEVLITGTVEFDSWSSVTNGIQTLQEALNGKANSFSGFTGSYFDGINTITVSNGIITNVS